MVQKRLFTYVYRGILLLTHLHRELRYPCIGQFYSIISLLSDISGRGSETSIHSRLSWYFTLNTVTSRTKLSLHWSVIHYHMTFERHIWAWFVNVYSITFIVVFHSQHSYNNNLVILALVSYTLSYDFE